MRDSRRRGRLVNGILGGEGDGTLSAEGRLIFRLKNVFYGTGMADGFRLGGVTGAGAGASASAVQVQVQVQVQAQVQVYLLTWRGWRSQVPSPKSQVPIMSNRFGRWPRTPAPV